jgi:hypothetical protein
LTASLLCLIPNHISTRPDKKSRHPVSYRFAFTDFTEILQRLYKGFTERFRDEDETARERAGFRLSPSNIKVKKRKGIEHGHRHAQSLFWGIAD